MATIGEFSKEGETIVGVINTLAFRATVRISTVPESERRSERSPDFRVFAGKGRAPVGAGWKQTSEQGRNFVSVQIDDPSLPAPINAALFEVEDVPGNFELVWNRPAPRG